ncbi:MAG: hypothetical protein L0G27_10075 [Paracoccus sp. (in: a-proteobacteria)]|nr:hypothetical protein [Paracoccus sp. (in: a-proteobacteria)]
MADVRAILNWIIPRGHRDLKREIAAEKRLHVALNRAVETKARGLTKVLNDMTDRKRGQNDA